MYKYKYLVLYSATSQVLKHQAIKRENALQLNQMVRKFCGSVLFLSNCNCTCCFCWLEDITVGWWGCSTAGWSGGIPVTPDVEFWSPPAHRQEEYLSLHTPWWMLHKCFYAPSPTLTKSPLYAWQIPHWCHVSCLVPSTDHNHHHHTRGNRNHIMCVPQSKAVVPALKACGHEKKSVFNVKFIWNNSFSCT